MLVVMWQLEYIYIKMYKLLIVVTRIFLNQLQIAAIHQSLRYMQKETKTDSSSHVIKIVDS